MESSKKLIYFLFILSAVLLTFSVYSFFKRPIVLKEYEISFIVQEGTVGFNLNTTSLTFGKIPPGGSGERKIDFFNYKDEKIDIEVLASKDIAEFLSFKNEYEVPAMSNVTIPINVVVPTDAVEGNYSGKIRIQLKR